jgi:TonB-dependent starch-binding outer membrane protein SusC
MNCRKLIAKLILPAFLFLFAATAYAQTKTITGKVTDVNGAALPGATVSAKGQNVSTATGENGEFTLVVPSATTTLIISSVGFGTQEVAISGNTVNATLKVDAANLSEVVVVGYGTQRRKDLTASIVTVTAEDFNKGPIVSPEQLIAGKVAGVQIMPGSGIPGGGSRIRIRGSASLDASNNPLIVVDGIPLEDAGVSGSPNPLALINPNDIESFNILKDASATAIYGSRGTNGVIIITTKRGRSNKLRVDYSTVVSRSKKIATIDVLSADEFRAFVKSKGNATQQSYLSNGNTNWQELIYRTSWSQDHNISLSGGIPSVPYRFSIGYVDQQGILRTSEMDRKSASLNVSPSFFNNTLRIDLSLRASETENNFANEGAISAAVGFDPTQHVRATNNYGGYFEWLEGSTGLPNQNSYKNPLGLLYQRTDESKVQRAIGNIKFDYQLPYVSGLRAILNLGSDRTDGRGLVEVPREAASEFRNGGSFNRYYQKRKNDLLDFYLNYNKDVTSIKTRMDVTAGYGYQDWEELNPRVPRLNSAGVLIDTSFLYQAQHTLISFYGRTNFTVMDKYIISASLRRDGSSRFHEDNRWGLFPSVAVAWRVKEESFLKNSGLFSDLKLRFSYGVTGQQEGIGNYDFFPRYTFSASTAQYQFGNTFYTTIRPEEYDRDYKWESTAAYNAGLDLGFLNGKLGFTVDVFKRETRDLLGFVAVPAGSNLSNFVTTNVAGLDSKGIELTLNATPVRTKNFSWESNFNITFLESKVQKLTLIPDTTGKYTITRGSIGGGVGNTIQALRVGYAPYAFHVYKQVYDETGNPIQGLYADTNGDGIVNTDDRYLYKSPEARSYLGFSTQLNYMGFNLAFTLRGAFGNYLYNNISSNNVQSNITSTTGFLNNVHRSALTANFTNNQYFSDYYIENASFLKMDNISLGYDLGRLMRNDKMSARLSATVYNAFLITDYSGLDPEISGGIDNNLYPRPRTVSLALNLGF